MTASLCNNSVRKSAGAAMLGGFGSRKAERVSERSAFQAKKTACSSQGAESTGNAGGMKPSRVKCGRTQGVAYAARRIDPDHNRRQDISA